MTTTNDITGDLVKTKVNSDEYRNNYDSIFLDVAKAELNKWIIHYQGKDKYVYYLKTDPSKEYYSKTREEAETAILDNV